MMTKRKRRCVKRRARKPDNQCVAPVVGYLTPKGQLVRAGSKEKIPDGSLPVRIPGVIASLEDMSADARRYFRGMLERGEPETEAILMTHLLYGMP